MFGKITRVSTGDKTYGFILGEDGISRFFMPSGMQMFTTPFDQLKEGSRVEFTHIDHPRGPRAIEVRDLTTTADLADDGDYEGAPVA